MPMAVPVIAAYAATTIAVEAGLVVAGTFAASAIGAVASVASSLAMSALTKQRGADPSATLGQPGGGRTAQYRQPTPPRELVLGRVKKSGPVMFLHTAADATGREDGFLFIQHALAAHRCKKIAELYFGTDLETDPKFTGNVRVGRNLGASDQVEDADFLADLGEDIFGDHWLRGVTNTATRLKSDNIAFPNGLPNISAIVWGSDEIYDPRTGTTGFTNNAALCYAWWKTWSQGMKVSWDDIDEDTLIDSANVADERERVLTGSTTFTVDTSTNVLTLAARARNLDVGDGVRISSSGALPTGLAADTTYYVIPAEGTLKLATSPANAFTETAIDITTAGSGTLTLTYWDEARYKLNAAITLDQDKFTIRDMLLAAMGGFDVEVGGKWFIHAAAPTTPTQTLDETNMRGGISVNPKRSMRDKFNGVRARFVNPDNFWQPSDAPPLEPSSELLEEDNGIELYEAIDLPCVTSSRQAQRLMKLHLMRNRQQRTVRLEADYSGTPLRPLAGLYLDFPRYELNQAQHVVMGWKLSEDLGVDLVMQSDGAVVYEWDAETDERIPGVPQDVNLPDPSTIEAPEEVTVTTPTTSTFSHVASQWSEVSSIWLDGYDVEYRDAGGTDWTGYGRIGGEVSREVSLERSASQDIRARAVTRNGAASEFTENLAPAAPTSVSAVGGDSQITLDADVTPDIETIQIFVHTSDLVASASLLDTIAPVELPYVHGALGVSQTRYYWLRAIKADGNFSALSDVVSDTTDSGGGGE